MLIKVKRGWEMPERAATPESVFMNRRELSKGLAAGSILAAGAGLFGMRQASASVETDPTADLYPVDRNPKYVLDRDITNEEDAITYNNFFEFGTR